MKSIEELKSELKNEMSYNEILGMAKKKGLKQEFYSKEDIINWLLQNGLTWKEYELNYNPYITLKLHICRFFGIKKGWTVMDIGCGSCGTSVAAASLVGSKGRVIAVDQSEEEMIRCTNYIEQVGFKEIIETRLANVLNLEFENNYFDMILLLYSPQFLGYSENLKEVLLKVKNWTPRLGIADHVPVPSTYDESIYLLLNWLSNDVARICIERKTDRLFHPEEVRSTLSMTGWKIVKEKKFKVSKKNVWPEWAMKDNIKRLSKQIQKLKDPIYKEILNSRLRTIKNLTEKGFMPKPTLMFAAVAERQV